MDMAMLMSVVVIMAWLTGLLERRMPQPPRRGGARRRRRAGPPLPWLTRHASSWLRRN